MSFGHPIADFGHPNINFVLICNGIGIGCFKFQPKCVLLDSFWTPNSEILANALVICYIMFIADSEME